MNNSKSKYFLKFLTCFILTAFVYTNLGAYEFFAPDCNSETMSCCCKHSSEKNSSKIKIKKDCCCEIKEIPENNFEATIVSSDVSIKNPNSDCRQLCSYILLTGNYKFQLTESLSQFPPGKDLNILNSILRI